MIMEQNLGFNSICFFMNIGSIESVLNCSDMSNGSHVKPFKKKHEEFLPTATIQNDIHQQSTLFAKKINNQHDRSGKINLRKRKIELNPTNSPTNLSDYLKTIPKNKIRKIASEEKLKRAAENIKIAEKVFKIAEGLTTTRTGKIPWKLISDEYNKNLPVNSHLSHEQIRVRIRNKYGKKILGILTKVTRPALVSLSTVLEAAKDLELKKNGRVPWIKLIKKIYNINNPDQQLYEDFLAKFRTKLPEIRRNFVNSQPFTEQLLTESSMTPEQPLTDYVGKRNPQKKENLLKVLKIARNFFALSNNRIPWKSIREAFNAGRDPSQQYTRKQFYLEFRNNRVEIRSNLKLA